MFRRSPCFAALSTGVSDLSCMRIFLMKASASASVVSVKVFFSILMESGFLRFTAGRSTNVRAIVSGFVDVTLAAGRRIGLAPLFSIASFRTFGSRARTVSSMSFSSPTRDFTMSAGALPTRNPLISTRSARAARASFSPYSRSSSVTVVSVRMRDCGSFSILVSIREGRKGRKGRRGRKERVL